jgi:DNA-binding transcriptional LysR family regulator
MLSIHPMDIRQLDLNLLKAFDALATERAVGRAAGRIGLSQPAMSHALSRLRQVFGDELFVRGPRHLEPTARAREIVPLVTAAIEHIEAALNLGAAFDPTKSERLFTAGMAEYAEIALLGRLAPSFARQAPEATLRILPLPGREAMEQLDRDTVDVAVAFMRRVPPRFESQILLRDRFVLVARSGHPAAAALLDLADYAGLLHVLVSPGGATTGSVDQALAEHGLKRRIALLVSTYLALPSVLCGSDLVATVPERTARQIVGSGGLEISPLPLDLTHTVSMAWHRRNTGAPEQAWFRSLLLAAAAEDEQAQTAGFGEWGR